MPLSRQLPLKKGYNLLSAMLKFRLLFKGWSGNQTILTTFHLLELNSPDVWRKAEIGLKWKISTLKTDSIS